MGYQPTRPRSQSPTGSVASRTSRTSKASRSSKKSQNSDKQQSQRPKTPAEDEAQETAFCVLADLLVFNTKTHTWTFPRPSVASHSSGQSSTTSSPGSSPGPTSSSLGPSSRYAHLSCITNNCLVILGGQCVFRPQPVAHCSFSC